MDVIPVLVYTVRREEYIVDRQVFGDRVVAYLVDSRQASNDVVRIELDNLEKAIEYGAVFIHRKI